MKTAMAMVAPISGRARDMIIVSEVALSSTWFCSVRMSRLVRNCAFTEQLKSDFDRRNSALEPILEERPFLIEASFGKRGPKPFGDTVVSVRKLVMIKMMSHQACRKKRGITMGTIVDR
jgi:hypothetical protein